MKGMYAAVGLALLGAGLAGWVALGWAQTDLPPAEEHAKEAASPVAPAPSGSTTPAVSPARPTSQPVSTPPANSAATLPPPQFPPQPTPTGVAPAAAHQRVGAQAGNPAPAQVFADDKAADLGPGANNDNPTGRQEPAVSLEWIGPPAAKVGLPADYSIMVRNACNIPVQQVMVRVRIPATMTVGATDPKAITEDNVLVWDVGTLTPKQEKNLQLRLVANAKGDVGCQAWVTFTGSSSMRIRIREPKLTLKAAAPEKVLVGDAANFVLTVTNPGDGPAEQVKIRTTLSEGLEHARGNQVDFEVGNLGPGESRSVQLICATKGGGEQKCDAVAEADGGLKAQDRAIVNVIMPQLKLEVAGPKLRYLDRKAVYTFKVINPGDASATNVTVSDLVPQGFKFLSATDGGRHDFATRTISWFLGEIGAGQMKEVKMEVLAVNVGEHKHHATAMAARGLKEETEIRTEIVGISAILLEVVDTEDPVEVGADTSYEIRITNTGSKTETDIKVICTIPDKMQFKSAQGPTRFHEEGQNIVFEPIAKLAPRADAIIRVNVKATAAGSVRFKTQITSTNLVEPVIEMEATRIYED